MESSAAEIELEESGYLPPPLKWAGGKRWLVPRLITLYQASGSPKLVEPFVGGMAVSLGLQPKSALLSDINPHSINFYRHLAKGLRISFEMHNSSECFYKNRTRFNELISAGRHQTKEAAGLFYYLNRTCFNGLCRFNSTGLFNVPFGKYRAINYCRSFDLYRKTLSPWEFALGDFEELSLCGDEFLYADPPYDVEFTRYSKDDFKWDDQVRLAHWLTKHRGPTVVSNQATPRVLELYSDLGFRIETVDAPRRISCTGDRSTALEMVATRNISDSRVTSTRASSSSSSRRRNNAKG